MRIFSKNINFERTLIRKLYFFLFVLLFFSNIFAQERTEKLVRGYGGGMMIHTGFLFGSVQPIGYKASGAPIGLGGTLRVQLGNHLMVGGEGYVSTLHQMKNGSYLKYGWGGILVQYFWQCNKVMPYLGLTVGGGAQTSFLMFDGNQNDWELEENVVFHKQGFMALTPFAGCDFILTKTLRLTLKVDWLNTFGRSGYRMPTGPRLYFGILFYH